MDLFPHYNLSRTKWFGHIQARAELHRPCQTTKFAQIWWFGRAYVARPLLGYGQILYIYYPNFFYLKVDESDSDPEEDKKFEVFISYKRVDHHFAANVKNQLLAAGITPVSKKVSISRLELKWSLLSEQAIDDFFFSKKDIFKIKFFLITGIYRRRRPKIRKFRSATIASNQKFKIYYRPFDCQHIPHGGK